MSDPTQETSSPARGSSPRDADPRRDLNTVVLDDRDANSSPPTPPTIPDTSRRALVRSAMESIQLFKQSWKSIMFLKSGIGLGQVVVLVVLLSLASVLPSPLYPNDKQMDSTDACPHPGLFQAWIIVQIIRLTVCWSVSCWVAVRAQRALRREQQANDQEAAQSPTTPVWTRYASPRTPGPGSQPSLSHSLSSSSQSTLEGLSSSSHGRNNSAEAGNIATIHSSSATFTNFSSMGGIESVKINSSSPVASRDPRSTVLSSSGTIYTPSDDITRTSSQSRPRSAARIAQELEEREDAASRDFASLLDRLAPFINKALGLISFVLFILGNVLLFYPLPSRQDTCYHGAPMLWWGTMAVTGVGWFLFGQIVFVVAFITIGGHAISTLLRRLHIVPTPPQPEPPRPPQPDPLSPQELSRLQVVCFVPHPDPPSAPVTPVSAKSMADARSQPSASPAKWDWTRFPYPAHYLKPNKAICAICQENFTEPKVIRRILYEAEPLRILGCGHVYHTECVDKWLTEKSGICPFCNTDVRSTMAREENGPGVPSEAPRRWWNIMRRSQGGSSRGDGQ